MEKHAKIEMQRGLEKEVDEVRGQAPGIVKKKKKKFKSKNRRKWEANLISLINF